MLLYIDKLYTTDKRYEDKRITLKLNFTLFALSKKKNEQNHYFFHTVLRLNQILCISYCCFKINILICMQTNIFKNTSTCTCHFYNC